MEALNFAIPLVVAFAVARVSTPLAGRLALAWGVVDRPNERGVSERANMPLLGGLAVAAGLAAGMAVALPMLGVTRPLSVTGLVIGGGLMLALGVWDDRAGLRAGPKFCVEMLAAAVAIGSGYQIVHITDPVSHTTFMLPTWLVWIVSAFWIIGITNAINLVDGLDGLAAGVSAIIGATLTLICWQADQMLGLCLGLALVGALLGFLPSNFAPARIFLGDTGALFTGYVLALLSLEGYRQVKVLTFVVPLLALAVPILDTVLSILRRIRTGTPIFVADRMHMHHRLLAVERNPRKAVLQFYFLTACFCLIAVSFTKIQGYAAALFLVAVGALTVRLLRNLGVLSTEPKDAEPPGPAEPVTPSGKNER